MRRSGVSCIQLTVETKKLLDNLGKKGMTYEEIILGLISKDNDVVVEKVETE